MTGYVYLIGSRKHNWYKIGKSKNASIRITELGILLPFRIEIIAVWKSDNHHALERLMHERYEKQKINGEWFSFGEPQLKRIIELMSSLQVESIANFTNIPIYVAGPAKSPSDQPKKTKGGLQARIDQLIKERARLSLLLKDAGIEIPQ